MSSLDSRNVSRSNRTRGRIAEILSSARASLQEPSRPITPLTLDQRTSSMPMQGLGAIPSIDPYSALQKKVSKKKSRENMVISSSLGMSESHYQQQARSTHNAASLDLSYEQESIHYYNKTTSSTTNASRYASVEYEEEEEDYYELQRSNSSNNNNSSTGRSQSNSKPSSSSSSTRISQLAEEVNEQISEKRSSSEVKLILIDFRDYLTKLDLELNTNIDMIEQDFLAILFKSKEFVEMLLKLLRKYSKTSSSSSIGSILSYQDLFEVQPIIWDVCTRMSDLNISMDLKQSFYVLMLKYCINTFTTEEISTHQHSFSLQMMEYLVQAIYNIRLHSPNSAMGRDVMKSTSSLHDSFDAGQSSAINNSKLGGSSKEEELSSIVNVMDVVIECAQFSNQHLEIILNLFSNGGTNGSNSSDLDKSIQIFNNPSVTFIFNIAAYSTAVLRAYSNEEIDRKRLMHTNIVETVILKCIKSYEKHPLLRDFMTAYNNLRSKSFSKLNKKDKKLRKQMTILLEKLLPALIQTIGMIRNIALEKSGREMLSKQRITARLCHLLSSYQYQAEVIVNIARVLAKLSLYDHVRSQISQSRTYLTYLVQVIHHEANICKKIMEEDEEEEEDSGKEDEDDEADEDEDVSWPAWHTWPVISRIAFTLGNLTTSNESNRLMIGQELDGTTSILLLLQVCVNSLFRLTQQKQAQAQAAQQRRSTTTTSTSTAIQTASSIFSFAPAVSTSSNPYVSLDEDYDTAQDGKVEEQPLTQSGDNYEIDQSAEIELRDAIIKLVRLLANVSIDAQVGLQVGSKYDNLQILLELLLICDQSMEQEEMLLNVIAALTNLTFYTTQYMATMQQRDAPLTPLETRQQQRLDKLLVTLSTHLSPCLFHDNMEIVLECTRVLGNLTRRPNVILSLIQHRIDEALLLLLLQHSHTEMVASVAGVVVNFSSHSEGRKQLLQLQHASPSASSVAQNSIYYGGILMKFASRLRKLSMRDINIALLLSQVMFNLFGSAEYQQHANWIEADLAKDKIILTLEEWTELANDMLQQGDGSEAISDSEQAQYRQFIKIAQALMSILTDRK